MDIDYHKGIVTRAIGHIARFRFVILVAVSLLVFYAVVEAGYIQVENTTISFIQIATLLALAAASYQLYQTREMTKSLKVLSQSALTQYAGEFPQFIPKITKLLDGAENTVTIMCDIPGYGHYSNHDEYARYRAKLISLGANHRDINMTVYEKKEVEDIFATQFSEPLPKLRDQESLQKYKKRTGEDIETTEQLHKSLVSQNENECEQLKNYFSLTRVKKTMPVYFWIIDDRVAIFSFAGMRIKPSEVAFKTVDPKLIDIFRGILNDVTDTWDR